MNRKKEKKTELVIGIFILIIIGFLVNIYQEVQEMPDWMPPELMPGYAPTGELITGGVISLTIIPSCDFNLTQGWNFVSFCKEMDNKSIMTALESVNDSIRFVLEWNYTGQEFDVFSPKQSSPPFTEFNTNKSYFIYYTSADSKFIFLSGSEFGDENLSQVYGWNTPNYPYPFSGNVTRTLDSVSDQYQFLLKWNYTPQEFMVYSPLSSDPVFDYIYESEGMFLLISNSSGTTLRYNQTYIQSG